MDEFLYQIQGYPYWRKNKRVLKLLNNKYFNQLKELFYSYPDIDQNYLQKGKIGYIARTIVLSEFFLDKNKHPSLQPLLILIETNNISINKEITNNQIILNYCRKFDCSDSVRLLEMQIEKDGWEFSTNNKNQKKWNKYVNKKLKWLN